MLVYQRVTINIILAITKALISTCGQAGSWRAVLPLVLCLCPAAFLFWEIHQR